MRMKHMGREDKREYPRSHSATSEGIRESEGIIESTASLTLVEAIAKVFWLFLRGLLSLTVFFFANLKE